MHAAGIVTSTSQRLEFWVVSTMKMVLFFSSLTAAALLPNINCVYGFVGISPKSGLQPVLMQPAFRIKNQDSSSSSLLAHDAKVVVNKNKQNDPLAHSLNAAISLFCAIAIAPSAFAVSGGGLDYANLDLSGKDFSNGNYKGKDFTQVIAKGTNFENSNLLGCRFYKAFLVNANFKNSDLRGASLEDTSMDGAILDNANAAGAYFSASLLDAKSIAGADFTDAQLPPKLLERICSKDSFAMGSNSKTGVDTRESLMCPE